MDWVSRHRLLRRKASSDRSILAMSGHARTEAGSEPAVNGKNDDFLLV